MNIKKHIEEIGSLEASWLVNPIDPRWSMCNKHKYWIYIIYILMTWTFQFGCQMVPLQGVNSPSPRFSNWQTEWKVLVYKYQVNTSQLSWLVNLPPTYPPPQKQGLIKGNQWLTSHETYNKIDPGRPFGTSCAKASSRAFRSRARLGRESSLECFFLPHFSTAWIVVMQEPLGGTTTSEM